VNAHKLHRALWSIDPPDSALAQEQAVGEARERFAGRVAPPRGARVLWPRLAAAVVALLLAASFTPPGEAALGWVARLTGIGEVGGNPTLHHEFRPVVNGAQPTVIANGRAPDGHRFEIVSYRGHGTGFTTPTRGKLDARICFDVDLIDPNRVVGGYCGALPPRNVVSIQSSKTGLRLGPSAESTIEGTVSPGTARVVIRSWGPAPVHLASPIRATLAPVRGRLLPRIGASLAFEYYVAFLPRGVHPQDVRVVSLDRAGDVIGRDRLRGGRPDYPGAYAPGTTNYLQERDLRGHWGSMP